MGSESHRRSRRTGAVGKPVAELVGKVLEPVIARRTGMTLDLMRAWPELAGPKYGELTRPEKIDWPRRVNHEDPFEPATLVVACDGSIAVFFQHDQTAILDRINLFFGFQAIRRIRIVQKPVRKDPKPARNKPSALSNEDEARLAALLDGIDDPELRNSLEALGRGVLGREREEDR